MSAEPVAWAYFHPRDDRFDGPNTIRRKALGYFTNDTRQAWVKMGYVFEPLYTRATLDAAVAAARAEERAVWQPAIALAQQCIAAAYNDQWPEFDRLSDQFDDACADAVLRLKPAAGQSSDERAARDAEIAALRAAAVRSRDGYLSERITRLPCLPEWRDETLEMLEAALNPAIRNLKPEGE